MLRLDGLMGKEGKVAMGGYKVKRLLNPVLLPPVLEHCVDLKTV